MKIINEDAIKKMEEKYNENPTNKVVENAIFKNGIQASATNNEIVKNHTMTFSVETKFGGMTNQKSSGRCWIFAALNSVRIKLMKELNLEDLELSQNFVHFYDKLEKTNKYLAWLIESGLELDNEDRLFRLFNQNPISDGGYWEFFVNLVEKYGICPKAFMNESFHSEATNAMVEQINWRLKAYTFKIKNAFAKNHNLKEVEEIKENALADVYNILIKCLGKPPKSFTFEFKDKDKKFVRLPEMTPLEFYKKYVGDDLLNKVDVIADPRSIYPKNQLLIAPFMVNVVGGKPLTMLNVDIEVLKQSMIDQLKAGESSWFGCDVTSFISKQGILDSKLYDYDEVLTQTPCFSKKEKFESRASVLSHAMNMIGVNLDENDKPINWKVENSWGDDNGKKGYWSMSDQWFTDYNYMAIIDKKYLPKAAQEALKKSAIEISPFDPLCEE